MRANRRMVTIGLPNAVFDRIDREAAARRTTKQELLSKFLAEYVATLPPFEPPDDDDDPASGNNCYPT